jgi:hypothetical protein
MFFGLFLFLNVRDSFIAGAIITILLIAMFVYSIYQIINRRQRNLLFLKGLSGSIFLSITSICLFISLFFVGLMNVMITHFNDQEIGPFEKFELQVNAYLPVDPYAEHKEAAESKKIDHLNVFYSNSDIKLVENEFEEARKISERLFGEIEDKPIDLILLDETPDSLLDLDYVDYLGFYDPIKETMGVIIPEDANISSPLIVQTFYHEYAHYFFDQALAKEKIDIIKIPIWFNEGVAEYASYNGYVPQFPLTEITPFDTLKISPNWIKALEDNADVYTQSYYAVQILTDEFGEGIIMDLLRETKKTSSFEEALKKKTDYTYKDLERKIMEKQ